MSKKSILLKIFCIVCMYVSSEVLHIYFVYVEDTSIIIMTMWSKMWNDFQLNIIICTCTLYDTNMFIYSRAYYTILYYVISVYLWNKFSSIYTCMIKWNMQAKWDQWKPIPFGYLISISMDRRTKEILG